MSRRFRPPRRSNYYWLIAVIVIALLRWWAGPIAGPRPPLPEHSLEPGEHRIERVVDGDTLLIEPHERLRLIGVNAPETVKPDWPIEPWGPEASAFTKQFVSGGRVRLEFDDERFDEYGRYLAYVWVGDQMLNEALVRAGLARFERGFHYSAEMKRRFRKAEDDAKRKHLGIWSGHPGPLDAR
jgi:micrococcal nuclease